VKHKASDRRFAEEQELIGILAEEAKQRGYKLLNHCAGYDDKATSRERALRDIESFCRSNYCSLALKLLRHGVRFDESSFARQA
jgi:hypothetical protein